MRKFLRIAGISILVIILIPLVAALFIPKEYSLERSTIISQPSDSVFTFLVMLKNHDQFSVWEKMDPDMKKEYRGTDGTVGFVSAWKSEMGDVGSGEQEIKNIVPGERIDYTIRFLKPFKSVSDAWFITEAAGDSATNVRWGFTGTMNYPFNVLRIFMNFEDAVGKDYEKGLANLKAILEKP
ncbi:MAG TPA: SRPBCC family protein [Bacteroidales bacterium]|nr:SRPBCC family protein [Bacteroidales bacterium]HRZ47934.1 SRPBCC family protein [Bacteroidales bacterium]